MSGVERIADERVRQRRRWDDAHDDQHRDGVLAMAASSLARGPLPPGGPAWVHELVEKTAPDRLRQLTIAGALVAAEIDRLERAADPEVQPCAAPSDDELQAQGSREDEALFRGWLARVLTLKDMTHDEDGPRMALIYDIHADVAKRHPLGIAVHLNEVIALLAFCGNREDLNADALEDLANDEKHFREINGGGP